jgi:hypothetical protein
MPWGLRSSFAGTSRIKFTGSVEIQPSQRQTFSDLCTPEQGAVYRGLGAWGCRALDSGSVKLVGRPQHLFNSGADQDGLEGLRCLDGCYWPTTEFESNVASICSRLVADIGGYGLNVVRESLDRSFAEHDRERPVDHPDRSPGNPPENPKFPEADVSKMEVLCEETKI